MNETVSASKPFEEEGSLLLTTRFQSRAQHLDAIRRFIDRNADILTLTRIYGMRRRHRELMQLCLLRMQGKWIKPSNELYDVPPGKLQVVELRSLRKDENGKFLPVPYKTGQEDLSEVPMGKSPTITAVPKTDPETGIFHLPFDEANKILKYYGRDIVPEYRFPIGARINDRTGEKVTGAPRGRRWLVEEVGHTYVEASPDTGTGPMVIE